MSYMWRNAEYNRKLPRERPNLKYREEIRVVLLGRTGAGKSATGNSIFGHRVFESYISSGSVTSACVREEKEINGTKFVIVDTPGLFDTHMKKNVLCREIVRCISMSTPGPHIFLIVIKVDRFTNEEKISLEQIFEMFGEQITRFVLIVFTHKDTLDGSPIEKFIDGAPNYLKSVIRNCNNNYVTIDNHSGSISEQSDANLLIKAIQRTISLNADEIYSRSMYDDAELAIARRLRETEMKKNEEKLRERRRIEEPYRRTVTELFQEKKQLAYQSRESIMEVHNLRDEKASNERKLQELQQVASSQERKLFHSRRRLKAKESELRSDFIAIEAETRRKREMALREAEEKRKKLEEAEMHAAEELEWKKLIQKLEYDKIQRQNRLLRRQLSDDDDFCILL